MFLEFTFAVTALQSPLPACRPVPDRAGRAISARPTGARQVLPARDALTHPVRALAPTTIPAPAVPPDDLYSARARRRLASLLRLRLLELRKQGLERVTEAIEREFGGAAAVSPH
jgi:hypothetical protein